MNNKPRAIVGARVSVLTGPQKVSHEAQLETAAKWARSNGYEIVGQFEDLGVSASVPPEKRPDLGLWLTEEGAAGWEAIVWSKMDRAFRSTRHCVDFARWAEENQKVVVFAEDGLTLNYRPGAEKDIEAMMSEFFIYLGAFFAQLELNRFKTRAEDSHRVLRQMDRWASGTPPLGFKTVPHPTGKGKGLATDEAGKELLESMADKLLDGWSFVRIADWLNESGELTNLDRARVGRGEEPKDKPWTVSVVIEALTSPRTQGMKLHKGQTVLDGTGQEIRLAPPTFDADKWRRIQDAVALRRLKQRVPSQTQNAMLGVGFCGAIRHVRGCPRAGIDNYRTPGWPNDECDCPTCGAQLAQQVTKKRPRNADAKVYRYYRCSRTPSNCLNVLARAEDVEDLLEEAFLEKFGDDQVTRREFVAGEDRSDELDRAIATIERLRREQDAGLIRTDDDERVYQQRMTAQLDIRDKLAAEPRRAAEWVVVETGQTYREAWADSDHRELLVGAGVRFVLHQGKPINFEIQVPWEYQPEA